ncbi:MAG: 50S ribosomal protein L21 [Candidatus Dormibacteraeota bacterium]|nr:50S ribosomal protein L21 [Candidatus Dormibacteraeota bacterium]
MYAILQHGGHQYRVTTGDRLLVDRLPAEVGDTVSLEPVLFLADGESSTGDTAALRGASVTAVVVAHRKGHKIRVFSYKPKKRHRRTLGYRSQLTELRVEAVVAPKDGDKPAARRTRAKSEPAAEEATETAPATKPARKSPARKKAADGA